VVGVVHNHEKRLSQGDLLEAAGNAREIFLLPVSMVSFERSSAWAAPGRRQECCRH